MRTQTNFRFMRWLLLQEVAVFRHKNEIQEFEVMPNPKTLKDSNEAKKQVSNRYKKIKERVRALSSALHPLEASARDIRPTSAPKN